jgi:hypothetical protein
LEQNVIQISNKIFIVQLNNTGNIGSIISAPLTPVVSSTPAERCARGRDRRKLTDGKTDKTCGSREAALITLITLIRQFFPFGRTQPQPTMEANRPSLLARLFPEKKRDVSVSMTESPGFSDRYPGDVSTAGGVPSPAPSDPPSEATAPAALAEEDRDARDERQLGPLWSRLGTRLAMQAICDCFICDTVAGALNAEELSRVFTDVDGDFKS